MWTYARAYKPLLASLERISYHAETEFYQSLNKNRLIAFIGSGVSLPYGRLSWSELCALLIMDVDEEFWKTLKQYNNNKISCVNTSGSLIKEAKFLHCTLRTVLGEKKIKEDEIDEFYAKIEFESAENLPKGLNFLLAPTIDKPISTDTTVLELCSELANLLDQYNKNNNQKEKNCSHFLKQRAANYLTESAIGQFESRLKLLNGYGKDTIYHKWKNTNFKKSYKITDKQSFDKKLQYLKYSKQLQVIKNPDFRKNWLNDNGKSFKRAAIEERPWILMYQFFKRARNANRSLSDLTIFDKLFQDLFFILSLASMPDAKIDQGKWADPIKTIIDKLNINRLVTLNYDTELERYFLQTKDYKVIENDPLLKPVDQQLDVERITKRKNGFGSQFTSVTLEKNLVGKLINFAVASKHNQSFIFHLHGRGDCAEDLILTENDYQELYVRSSESRRAFSEGINTLFSGNDVLFLGVGMNESDLLRPLRQFVSESRNASLRQHGILALLNEDLNTKKTEEQSLKLHTKFGVKSIFYTPKTKFINKAISRIEKLINKADNPLQCQLSLMKLRRKLVGLQSQSFDNRLLKLAKDQQQWWKDWREAPGKRAATYINWNAQKSKELPRLWIRQKVCPLPNHKNIDYFDNSNRNNTKIVNTIFSEVKDSIDNAPRIINEKEQRKNYRIIHRFSGVMGVGKGTLVHSIQTNCKKPTKNNKYHGYFFADAKFSTEYTSVISAISRFLAGIIADQTWDGDNEKISKEQQTKIKICNSKDDFRHYAEEEKTFNKEWVKKNLGITLPYGKTRILRTYLAYFAVDSKKHRESIKIKTPIPRILICLSGLERLVDKFGYAHNALHRAFFRELIDPENNNIPLTLILISDKPETPIRYLSEINKNKQLERKGNKIPWNSQKAKLECWNIIPKTPISDRFWLPIHSKHPNSIAASRICDQELGILVCEGKKKPERKSLAKVSYDYMSVHLWLRLLLNELQLKKAQKQKTAQKEILDSLNLAASRNGVNGVINCLLDIYDSFDTEPQEKNRSLSAYQAILRHLALFSIPIERAVLVNCPEVVEAVIGNKSEFKSEKDIAERIEVFLQTLNKTGLILKIGKSGSINSKEKADKAGFRYTLASIMRDNLSQRMDFHAYTHGEFSFFDVSLYPAQPLDLPSPKETDFLFIGNILQTIISNARYNLEFINPQKNYKHRQDSLHSISRSIRAAVNLVNGSFSIGVVSRLEKANFKNIEYICGHAQPFEAYHRWLRCLSNIAVAIEAKRQETGLKIQRPLYETEAAWIFNEQGLVNLIQGKIFDSIQLFRIAKERLDSAPWIDPDSNKSYPPLTSLRRVELNYAIAMLEFGKIKDAENEFYRLYRRGKNEKRNKTSLTVYLACIYLGLCYHLQGRMTQAEERYEEALNYFKRENKNFLRVTAIIRTHYGNLKRGLNDYESANLLLNIAIKASASAKQMDIFHHASVSKAKLLLAKSDKGFATQALTLLNNAERYAEKMGLYKLKVHADIIRGEILIAQKQYTMAGKLLANAIAISNKHGMNIMKMRALQVYGKALEKRGTDKRVTDEVLNTAKYLSENTGYLVQWIKED